MIKISAESILNALPGIVLIKEVHQGKARWVWSNDACAQIAGFKNGDNSLGIYDEEMRCDAAKYAANFLENDLEVLSGQNLKLFEVYTYADGEKHALIGDKKLLQNPAGSPDQIIYTGINIHLHDFGTSKFCSLITNDARTGFVGNGKYGSYSVCDKIDCLSEKESECFFYWIRGYTAKEIAKIIQRSHRTIEIHLSNIKLKLGLQKKSQLVEWAAHTRAFTKIPSGFFERQYIG